MGPERQEEALLRSALAKRQSGKTLSREESAALRRAKKREEERLRDAAYAAVPKKLWGDWSGRQTKVLNEQARRYGAPIGGRVIDLAELARWLHDFLAENARKLASEEERGPDTAELIKREQLETRRLERLRLEGQLIDREEVRQGLRRAAALIRTCGDNLQKHHGAGALKTLNDALSDAQAEIDHLFPDVLARDGDRDSQ